MAPDAQQYFNSIPPATWYLMIFSFSLSLFTMIGAIKVEHLYFDIGLVLKLQLWRIVTSLFYFGPYSISFLIHFFAFIKYSKELEEDVCNKNIADYVWCLILGLIVMIPIGYYLNIYFFNISLLMYMIYIVCNFNPDVYLTLMFIPFKVKAVYFPLGYLLINLPLGFSAVPFLIGMFAGHVYYFIRVAYPKTFQKTILHTPNFLYKVFPKETQTVQNPFSHHNWGGSGRKLRG